METNKNSWSKEEVEKLTASSFYAGIARMVEVQKISGTVKYVKSVEYYNKWKEGNL